MVVNVVVYLFDERIRITEVVKAVIKRKEYRLTKYTEMECANMKVSNQMTDNLNKMVDGVKPIVQIQIKTVKFLFFTSAIILLKDFLQNTPKITEKVQIGILGGVKWRLYLTRMLEHTRHKYLQIVTNRINIARDSVMKLERKSMKLISGTEIQISRHNSRIIKVKQ